MKYINSYKIFESKLYSELSDHGAEDIEDIDYIIGYFEDGEGDGMYHLNDDIELLSIREINYLNTIGDVAIKNHFGKDYIEFKVRKELELNIYKNSDELYYIIDLNNSLYYKCDTFEGVKQLIKDLI